MSKDERNNKADRSCYLPVNSKNIMVNLDLD